MKSLPRKRELTNNEKAAIIAIIAGILLIVAGVSGATRWDRLEDFVKELFGGNILIKLIFYIFVALGSLGGLLVIIGGLLMKSDRVGGGKALILIGTGFGIITLLVVIAMHLRRGEVPFASGIGPGAVGIILSIVARFKAQVPGR